MIHDRRRRPRRADLDGSTATARGDEQHPVGNRVEDLAELAALVEVTGDVAVDPVGGAEDREQHGGRDRLVLAQQQPEEHAGRSASRTTEIRFGIVQMRAVTALQGTGARPEPPCQTPG